MCSCKKHTSFLRSERLAGRKQQKKQKTTLPAAKAPAAAEQKAAAPAPEHDESAIEDFVLQADEVSVYISLLQAQPAAFPFGNINPILPGVRVFDCPCGFSISLLC
jgi:hypothetical protein